MSILDLSKNFSLYTVPAAFILTMVPHTYASLAAGKLYDPAYPRKIETNVAADDKCDKVTKQRILRAHAASENGLETLGFYAAAVVAANVAGVETATLNALALGYLATRALYNFVYVVAQDNRKLAPLRSLCWATGVGLTFTMYIKAGAKMA